MPTSSSPAWRTISGTFAASSKGMTLTATSSMGPAARFRCRADPRTPHLLHITSNDRSCSCWIVSRQSKNSTARASRAQLGSRGFHTHHSPDDKKEGIDEEASLLRAADLIGQLGDPHYLRKVNALYYEFEEIGLNRQLGYESPADLVDKYPQFYWNRISPHIQCAVHYLNVTSSGRRWIAELYSNVFRAEREPHLAGPQP